MIGGGGRGLAYLSKNKRMTSFLDGPLGIGIVKAFLNVWHFHFKPACLVCLTNKEYTPLFYKQFTFELRLRLLNFLLKIG